MSVGVAWFLSYLSSLILNQFIEPHFGGSIYHDDHGTEEKEDQQDGAATTSSVLYHRINELSERIRIELINFEDTESLGSSRATPFTPSSNLLSDEGEMEHLHKTQDEDSDLQTDTSTDSEHQLTSPDHKSEALAVISHLSGNRENCKMSSSHAEVHTDDDSGLQRQSIHEEGMQGASQEAKSSGSGQYMQVDPKLQKAIEKMRKLDAKLADLAKVGVYNYSIITVPCVM